MWNTSADFKAAIFSSTRELAMGVTLMLPGEDPINLSPQGDIEGSTLSIRSACMQKGFELGAATASSLTLSLNNRSGRWDDTVFDGATLVPYCGVKLANGTSETVPMGKFIVDRPGRPYAILELEATDAMVLLDEPLADLPVTWPATHRTLLMAIGQHCNVPIDVSVFAVNNIDRQAAKPAGYDELSCRDIVGEIALMAGGFARINRIGALEIVPLTKPTPEVARVMPTSSRRDFRQDNDPITITGIRYKDFIIGTVAYPLEIDDLVLLDDEDAPSVLQSIWGVIGGYTYTPYTASYFGDPSFDAGDVVLHETRDGKSILSTITQHTYKHGGLCTMTAKGQDKRAAGYKSANARRLSQIAARVADDIEHKLTTFEQSSAQISDMLGLMLGVHKTIETLEDGSNIYYFHNHPILEDSTEIWKFNGQVLGFSDDGGQTWGGVTVGSSLVVKIIQTVGISAEWIRLTSGQDLETALDEIETTPGPAGKDAVTIHIDSVNGNIFKNTAIATSLVVTVITGDKWIDNAAKLKAEFGAGAHLQWSEKRFGELTYEDIPRADERLSDDGFMFAISAADILTKSTFRCDLLV